MPYKKQKERTYLLMQQELELQLHEQYAINNNATLSSMLTLFCTMLATLGGYGYVFINSVNEQYPIPPAVSYTTDDLLFTTLAAIVVLSAISSISISTGYKGRMEQFVVYAIRKRYYSRQQYRRVFSVGYHPFKKGCYTRPIQDPYNTFLYIVSFMILAISAATLLKTDFYRWWVLAIACASYLAYIVITLRNSYTKYKKRFKERILSF